jgi:hypothetical protein
MRGSHRSKLKSACEDQVCQPASSDPRTMGSTTMALLESSPHGSIDRFPANRSASGIQRLRARPPQLIPWRHGARHLIGRARADFDLSCAVRDARNATATRGCSGKFHLPFRRPSETGTIVMDLNFGATTSISRPQNSVSRLSVTSGACLLLHKSVGEFLNTRLIIMLGHLSAGLASCPRIDTPRRLPPLR